MGASELVKVAAALSFQRKLGCTERDATFAARAMHPLEAASRPVDRQLEKDMRKLSRRFAKASKKVQSASELSELTYVVLATYAHMARACGDAYYHPLFEHAAMEAQVDITPGRLEELKAKL